MATNTIKSLYGPDYLPTTVSTVLEAGASAGSMVKQITLVNSAATTETVELYIHTSTSVTNAHLVQKIVLSAGDTATFEGTLIVPSGSNLYGKTTNSSSVSVSLHGMEMT